MIASRLACTFLALGALAAGPSILAAAPPPAARSTAEDEGFRQGRDLSRGWHFRFGQVPVDVTDPAFDDSG